MTQPINRWANRCRRTKASPPHTAAGEKDAEDRSPTKMSRSRLSPFSWLQVPARRGGEAVGAGPPLSLTPPRSYGETPEVVVIRITRTDMVSEGR
ncbi:hypothetical protein E2C01_086911 [Portunus trituberculatus]|uniref:Uncharacterized protein n=1 Tax=Portunus trituberculatus TaxID=210409 RepID=A0A5B7J544_PORTR|nr:hypothetical protein [Portunus trituberculatus]